MVITASFAFYFLSLLTEFLNYTFVDINFINIEIRFASAFSEELKNS